MLFQLRLGLSRIVESATTAKFEADCQNICEEFNMEPRCWLKTMYEKRHHWVQCYLNDIFRVDPTTCRSERMNTYLRYVHSNIMLNALVV